MMRVVLNMHDLFFRSVIRGAGFTAGRQLWSVFEFAFILGIILLFGYYLGKKK
jgi:hypothetical protein